MVIFSKNENLTKPGRTFCFLCFCSDTRYLESIIPIIKNVDVCITKQLFLHDLKKMADYTGHSTALEAAKIARKANVKN